jgi:hypothetical protein
MLRDEHSLSVEQVQLKFIVPEKSVRPVIEGDLAYQLYHNLCSNAPSRVELRICKCRTIGCTSLKSAQTTL